ncbi:glycosyltransferase family 1 [Purpureocillium lavendulum]|uniref:Glycosyltransferase family 1 n=1 Tax=Purpureocillium lavendulum TaxID=1247861 RepID=A0AB34FDQ2_9HYPO|nr:glycosyltransferase family 1 [Purpureocillium lavendulum]
MATRKFTAASPISWHELPSPDYLTAVYRHIGNISGMIFPPGLKGSQRLAAGMGFHLDPWERDEYVRLYQHVRDLIIQLDPAVIVLDMSLRPALDATRDLNRNFVILSPNALVDTIAADQPWGKSLWKYPATASGLAYPLEWKWVPLNMYLHVRFAIAYLVNQDEESRRAYYRSKGIQNHDHFLTIKDIPWITMTIPEAALPIAVPNGVTECGPVVLDVANVKDVNQELHGWLQRGPTILINLGSLMKYDESRAKIMAHTIQLVLQTTDVQVIWKFAKLGDYGDEFLRPLLRFKDNSRLRLSSWLEVEPAALLHSGQIVLSVHHGGANCFHEAI